MSGVDTRNINRDSLFLMGDLRVHGEPVAHRVRVRNLSSGGMMAETELRVLPGTRVTVELKNLPPVEGSVAWVQEHRFGVAFAEEIDPKAPRSQIHVGNDLGTPRFVRPSTIAPPMSQTDPKRLRTI
jgi:hypothetical protein